jgi:hypothetical protein
MSLTCVNSDELPEVVYSDSPQMKDDDLRDLFANLAKLIAQNNVSTDRTMKSSEPHSIGIGRWIGIAVGTLTIVAILLVLNCVN